MCSLCKHPRTVALDRRRRMEEVARMALQPEVKHAIQAALKKLSQEIDKDTKDEPALFDVRPISNGFLVTFNSTEEYEVNVPTYDAIAPVAPGAPRIKQLPAVQPKMQPQKRWKIKRATVYCKDAEEIKAAVDEALRLEEKVKLLIAEGVLSGDKDFILDNRTDPSIF